MGGGAIATIGLLIFGGCSAALAVLLLRAAKSRGGGANWANAARCWLPVLLLFALMAQAWWTGSGTRLTASIDKFSIPAAAAPIGAVPELMFRVGDRSEIADLIVRPYLKPHLNRLFDGDPPREFVRIEAARASADPAALTVRIVLLSYAGKPDEDVPGMHVAVETNPCNVQFAARRELELRPGRDARVRIFRDNFEGSCNTARQTRYAERRSFRVKHVAGQGTLPGRIEISFAEPLRTDAGTCLNPRDILLPASDERALPPGYLMPRNLEFGSLGAGGPKHPHAVLASDAIGPAADEAGRCTEDSPPVRWPENAGPDRTTLTLDFNFLTLPWVLLWLLLGAAGGAWLFGREAQRNSPVERILMPLLLYLLGLRAMSAIAGASYDAQIDPNDFYRDAAVSIIALPPLLAALIRPAALASRDLWLRWLTLTLALTVALVLWFKLPWLSWGGAVMLIIPSTLLIAELRLRWWLGGVGLLLLVSWQFGWLTVSFDLAILALAFCGLALRARRHRVQPFVVAFDRLAGPLGRSRGTWPNRFAAYVDALTLRDRLTRRRLRGQLRNYSNFRRRALGAGVMSTALAIYLLAGIVVDPFSRIAAAVLVLIAIVVLVVGAIVTFRDVLRRVLVNRSLLFNAGVVALVLVGLLRWAMGLAGQQERIMDVIPISMGYLPAVIALAALTVAGLLDFRYFRNWGALVAAGAIGFAGGIVPFMVHDSGFALVHLFPLIGVAMAQLWRSNWPKVEAKHATAILALPAAGLLGLLVLNTALSVRDLPADNAKLSEAMNSALEFNANELRLVQIARPSAIEQVGTRAGYDQMEQTSMLHSLTSSLTGAGWLAPVELLSIRKEQTWDYGAAVHLMHPFGRIGLLAYLLVVFAGIWALYRARAALPEPPEGDTTSPVFLTIAGEMAAITLVFSAVYVSLGNLLLIPFTGRNLYLLAVLSVGDIVEALTLLALAALVITGARR